MLVKGWDEGLMGAGAVAGGEEAAEEEAEEEEEWEGWAEEDEPKTPEDLRPRSRSSQVMSSATKPISARGGEGHERSVWRRNDERHSLGEMPFRRSLTCA